MKKKDDPSRNSNPCTSCYPDSCHSQLEQKGIQISVQRRSVSSPSPGPEKHFIHIKIFSFFYQRLLAIGVRTNYNLIIIKSNSRLTENVQSVLCVRYKQQNKSIPYLQTEAQFRIKKIHQANRNSGFKSKNLLPDGVYSDKKIFVINISVGDDALRR